MSFDIEEMIASKQAFRQRLAALPIAEKLRLLDEMRARALAIRSALLRKQAMWFKKSLLLTIRESGIDE
jgi:hypothetical protein